MYFLGYKICLCRYQNLFERLKIPPNPHCQYGSGSRRTGGNLWINADPDPQNLLKICYSATTINNGAAFWTCHPLPTDTPPPSNSTDIQAVQSPCKCDLPSVSDPFSFFTDPDPDPVDPASGQYGSGYGSGSGSNPDPIRIQGFNDRKLKKNNSWKKN
jgi:hypothetical protein